MYTEFLFAVILVFFNGLRSDAATSRLVGGEVASFQLGRFHVSLQNLTGHHVCGGAVISRKHIVTAAHCVINAEPEYIKAVVGTTNLDVGGKRHDIQFIKLHEKYNPEQRNNDIAVLSIKDRFDLKHVEILDLYGKDVVEGDILIMSGFGAHEPHGPSSRQLYSIVLPVFSQAICQYAMRKTRNVTDSMFCTFTQLGQGTCHGDSGGPLVRNKKLVGVVSWGIPCAVGFPDVHTRVYPFINWLKKQIRYANCH